MRKLFVGMMMVVLFNLSGVFAADFHISTVQELYTVLQTAESNGEDDTIFFEAGTYSSSSTVEINGDDDLTLRLRPEPGVKLGEVVVDLNMNLYGNGETVILTDLVMDNNMRVGDDITFTASNCLGRAQWYLYSGGDYVITKCHLDEIYCAYSSVSDGGTLLVQYCSVNVIDNYVSRLNQVEVRDCNIEGNADLRADVEVRVENNKVGSVLFEAPTVFIRNNSVNGHILTGSSYTSGTDLIEGNFIHGDGSYGISFGRRYGTRIIRNNLIVNCKGGINIDNDDDAASDSSYVLNNTIVGCTGASGIYVDINSGGEVDVQNNLIWDGDSSYDDIYLQGSAGTKKLYNNVYHKMTGLWDESGGNIDVAPLFLDPAAGNYRVQANSACINAGLPHADFGTVDADGNIRVANGTVDIGAYEHDNSDTHPADADSNWTLSAAELTAYSAAWTNGSDWASGPVTIPIEYVTRAGYLKENGGAYQNSGGGKPLNWTPVQ